MQYLEFREEILSCLCEEMGGEVDLSIREVSKLNGSVKYGIGFEKTNNPVSPTVYLEEFYEKYKQGESIENICQAIIDFYKCDNSLLDFVSENFTDYDKAKGNLFIKMVNTSKNCKMLEDTPHKEFLDLSIVVYYELYVGKDSLGGIVIKQTHLREWGISIEELMEDAIKNSMEVKAFELMPLSEVVEEMLGNEEMLSDDEEVMYLLSNKVRFYGAGVICYPDILEHISDYLKEDYCILPSSIHELIIIPKSKIEDISSVIEMVREVNDTQVALEEILSYNIYLYNSKDKYLTMQGKVKNVACM